MSSDENNTPKTFFPQSRENYPLRVPPEKFEHLVPYGRDKSPNNFDKQSASGKSPEQYQMPLEYFVRLFAHSIVLDAFVKQDFPFEIKNWVEITLKAQLDLFCASFPSPSILVPLAQLVDRIKEQLGNLLSHYTSMSDNLKATQKELEEIKQISKDIAVNLDNYLARIALALENMDENGVITRDLAEICVEIVEGLHIEGWAWARAFVNTNQPEAELRIRHSKHNPLRVQQRNHGSTNISTHTDGDYRYILFVFCPEDFYIKQFNLLSFKFFHEYISHLNAVECDVEQLPRIKTRIPELPVEFDDGWMIHTAQTYFKQHALRLLELSGRLNRKRDIENAVIEMVQNSTLLPNQQYVFGVEWGYDLAERFFQLLIRTFGDTERASNLYYRFSFHLVSRCTYHGDDFDHLEFMQRLDSWMRSEKELQSLIEKHLVCEGDEEFLDVRALWKKIQTLTLEPDLRI